ncbi:ABC transporter [bacterium CG10_46_32]|nr:MAG: ABC transporter [bacterium CG10_46_32]PIR55829.1 MAG: ABC transporter [Parcubacteria group bacterium CG10_big_fil_rev_8_21_14_0_10_46_32]
MIQVQNLTKTYGATRALENVNFQVCPGEVLGFLGPNGAGKSTTMKIITGFISPSAGTVKVGDLDVVDNSFEIRQKLGYLAETNPLYTDMKVHEYLRFVAAARHIPSSERSNAIKAMVQVCGLFAVVGKSIDALSKGFRQRVGLAQAMIHNPDILILDEPTSGLDPNQIVEIRDLIRSIGKEKTIILSTHILPEVAATCSRVVIINNGTIVAQGTPDELMRGSSREVVYIKIKGDRGIIRQTLSEYHALGAIKQYAPEGRDIHAFAVEIKEGDGRELLFKAAVSNKWTLIEMYRKSENLEDVFRRLTTKENGV